MRNKKIEYYKQCSLESLDESEYLNNELNNDYGINLGSESKKRLNYEKILTNPKYHFNSRYFNEKK